MTKANDPLCNASIREWFAALSLQGMLASPPKNPWEADQEFVIQMTSQAVNYADALIAALNAPQENPHA